MAQLQDERERRRRQGRQPAAAALRQLVTGIGWRVTADLETGADAVVQATMGRGDEDGLEAALASPAGYIGLVASSRRAGVVLEALRERGSCLRKQLVGSEEEAQAAVEHASKPISGLRLGGEAATRAMLGSAYTWTVVFFLWMWLGALAVGASGVVSLLVSLAAAGAIFVFVRARGDSSS
jgi:hypothetical protein